MSKSNVIKRLEVEAIKEGVDAIVEVEYWPETTETGNLITVLLDMMDDDNETTTFTTNHTFIAGKGIMYLENLNFIHNQAEFEYFYKLDSKTDFPKPFFKIEYKLTGQVYMVYPESDEGLETYKKYFQYYSDFHLLKQREGWSYKMDGTKLVKRVLGNEDGFITKICVPGYDEAGRMIKLRIKNQNSQITSSEFIHYLYDEDNKLIERRIEAYDGTNIYEEYIYENSQLTGRKVFINSNSQKQLNLKSSINYYDSDYLKDFYFKEVAKTKEK